MKPLPAADVAFVAAQLPRDARVLVTGAAGFIGRWMVETGRAAGLQIVPLVRRAAGLADEIVADVRETPALDVTHVVHCATPVAVKPNDAELRSIIVDGTRRVRSAAPRARMLHLSSGAVYGRSDEAFVETQPCAPDTAYGSAKLEAEAFADVNARAFAFIGPGMQLDAHLAAGNFIRDGVRGGPIRLNSAGRAVRTYQYAADLAAWLWALLLRGEGVYNVGGEETVTIAELARTTGRVLGAPVEIGEGGGTDRYVPSCAKARAFGLRNTVPLEEAIRRTAAWHKEAR